MVKSVRTELAVLGLVGIQLLWVAWVKYPPTSEQLTLGVTTFAGLWLVRLISLGLLWLAARLVDKGLFRVVFFLVPSTAFWWMAYPLVVIRIFLVALGFWILQKKAGQKLRWWLGGGLVLLLLGYNGLVVKDMGNFLESADLGRNQTEVGIRINTEDTLRERVWLPIWFRRISYNKYFFALRNTATNALRFVDMESTFFQEVHPVGLKSGVLFFWPYVWLFWFSLWFLVTGKIKVSWGWGWLLVMAWLGYLFSDKTVDVRLSLLVLPLGWLLAKGWLELLKWNRLGRLLAILFVVAVGFGYVNDLRDRSIRPEYWLDNRPMVYDFLFKNIKQNLAAGDKVVVSSLVGPAEDYCRFYVGDCRNFTFRNFDLEQEKPEAGVMYAGFGGNFVGKEFGGELRREVDSDLVKLGYKILALGKVFDAVGFGYGKQLIVAGYLWKR